MLKLVYLPGAIEADLESAPPMRSEGSRTIYLVAVAIHGLWC